MAALERGRGAVLLAAGVGWCCANQAVPLASDARAQSGDGKRPVAVCGSRVGSAAGGLFGYRVGYAGDFNADGTADLFVSRPNLSSERAGSIDVYFAGVTPSDSANLTLRGLPHEEFGRSVAAGRDCNGDGMADIVVGSPGFYDDFFYFQEPRVDVFFGGATPDDLVDATILHPARGGNTTRSFGRAVALVGDMNGDGSSELLIGEPDHQNDASDLVGAAYLVYGGSDLNRAAYHELLGEHHRDGFGTVVSPIGDFNGDGVADCAVGAPYNDENGWDAGRVYVFFGNGANRPVAGPVLQGPESHAELGASIAPAGDIDGDGFDDVLVGAPGARGSGVVYLFRGGSHPDAQPDSLYVGEAASDRFGAAISVSGRVTAIGAPMNDGPAGRNSGAVYVFVPERGAGVGVIRGTDPFGCFGLSIGLGRSRITGTNAFLVGAPYAGADDAGMVQTYCVGDSIQSIRAQR